jgi:hypothetical protein
MKRLLLGVLCALIPANRSAALADEHDDSRIGQYFCYVDQAAGIQKHENERTFAGKNTLPDEDMKFFVRISRIELDATTRSLCAKTSEAFEKAFETGSQIARYSSGLFGSESFEDTCLKPFKAEIPRGASKEPWTLRGFGAYEFDAGIANMSFTLYGNNNFVWLFPYDDGPVIRSGRCERIIQKPN